MKETVVRKPKKNLLNQSSPVPPKAAQNPQPLKVESEEEKKANLLSIANSASSQKAEAQEEAERKRRPYTKRTPAAPDENKIKQEQAIDNLAKMGANLFRRVSLAVNEMLPNPIPPADEDLNGMEESLLAVLRHRLPTFDKWAPEFIFGCNVLWFVLPRIIRRKPKNAPAHKSNEQSTLPNSSNL